MNKVFTKKKGIIAALALVVVIAAVAISTQAANAFTLDKAKEAAKNYVPATAEFVGSEEENTNFEVYFYDKTNKESFEVEVSKKTESVRKVESQLDNDLGGEKIDITEKGAIAKVTERFAGITASSAELTISDGYYEYEVVFQANGFHGSADVNTETGAITESVIKYGSAVTIPSTGKTTEEPERTDNNGFISMKAAETAAIKLVGGGRVSDIDLDNDDGTYVYEVEVYCDGMEYDIDVDAKTGIATKESEHKCYLNIDSGTSTGNGYGKQNGGDSNSNSNSNSNGNGYGASGDNISMGKAKSIVLAKVSGATFREIQLEKDDGIWTYEGTAVKGDYEYEFEINAETGVIISWEKDWLEYDDDDWDDDDYDEYDD